MKRLLFLLLGTIIFTQDDSYFVEEYVFQWEYDQIGDIEIIIELDEMNSSINLCSSTTTCVVLSVNDVTLLVDQLRKTNDIYARFKSTEGDLKEEVVVVEDKLEVEYSKDITNGFRVKIYDQKNWDSIYLSRRETGKLADLLSNSSNLISFINKRMSKCLD